MSKHKSHSMAKLNVIGHNMENGNWSDAIRDYKALDITPARFQEFLANLEQHAPELLVNWALIGYYASRKETR